MEHRAPAATSEAEAPDADEQKADSMFESVGQGISDHPFVAVGIAGALGYALPRGLTRLGWLGLLGVGGLAGSGALKRSGGDASR